MSYVTSIERLAKEEGREEGILIGQILVLQKQLREHAIEKPDLELLSFLELSNMLEQLLNKTETFKQE